MLRSQLRNLRRVQIVALLVWGILFLAGTLWFIFQTGRSRRFENLYRSARAGNLESLQQPAEQRSSDSLIWLEKLAQDRNTFAEYRVAAINALSSRPTLHSEVLATLLWIEQPFDVRHAVVNAFNKHGCDDFCISAALYALHALWQGQPTAEMQLMNKQALVTAAQAHVGSELRNQSEKDYLMLLNKNPCGTKASLTSDYGASDSGFVSSMN